MIVLDASAVAELITDARGLAAAVRVAVGEDTDWVVPGHALTEAANALRGIALGSGADDGMLSAWFEALGSLELDERSVAPLLGRIRSLSSNANAYDAGYLALAEAVRATLVTTDRKLAAVPGVRAAVLVVDA